MPIAQRLARAAAVAVVCHGSLALASPCTSLLGARLAGDGVVTLAQDVPAAKDLPGGVYTAPDGHGYAGTPAFCRVAATLKPTGQSAIAIETWLPAGSAWNGRFVGTGNGGYAGAIVYSELAATCASRSTAKRSDCGRQWYVKRIRLDR